MKRGDVQAPLLTNHLTLRRQLRLYEDYLTSESVEAVAKAHRVSVEVAQLIIDRVPRELIPLTQLRKTRACLDLEELAQQAIERLRALYREEPWTIKDCISILNAAGTHFGRLVAAETPMVQQNNTNIDISADELLETLRIARSRAEAATHPGGNGNRLSDLRN